MSAEPTALFRALTVHPSVDGMRLDRFIARRFATYSRTAIGKGIKAGQITDVAGKPLKASSIVRAEQQLRIFLPGIAPATPAPPMLPILFEDERLAVIHKPAGMLAHPSGANFAWSLIRCCKDHWVDQRIDLVHRLDRDTSGTLVVTKDVDANRFLKAVFVKNGVQKTYEAICRGVIPWDFRVLDGPIDAHGGPVRILMAVRAGGLSARTDVTVLDRSDNHTRVRIRLHTGRTHQIRVHLAAAGFPLLGDRMYGLPFDQVLEGMDHGWTAAHVAQVGAEHHALHAASIVFPHPEGGHVSVCAPMPGALRRWWAATKPG